MSFNDRSGKSVAPAFLALSCVGFIMSTGAAEAQTASPPAEDEGVELQGVTVTDTAIEGESYRQEVVQSPKFTAPLIDTPRSVVVIPKEVIKDTGSATLVEALRTLPGITFGAAEGGNPMGDRPFIRGYDSQGSTYLDGVRDVGAQSREIFAVEQIQVVRGSDSTLGGRGAAGGTINIVSKMPQQEDFVSGALSYGTADYKRITADVNKMIGEQVGVRLNALWHDQDVAGRDALFQKRWGVAPSVTIGLGTPTRLTAAYYHLETDELPDSGIPYLYTITNAPSGFTNSQPAEDVVTANGRTGHVDRDTFYGLVDRDFRKTNVDQATVRVEHDFAGVTLRNTARYAHTDQRYIFTQPDDSQNNAYNSGQVWRRANTRFGYTESLINQTDLFGKLDTGGIEHSFALGGELAWEKSERGAYVLTTDPRCTAAGIARFNCTDLFNPDPADPWVNYTSATASATTPVVRGAPTSTTITTADTKALYAFDSITLMPSLIVNLGVRYDHYSTSIRSAVSDGMRPEVSREDDLFNYQAGVVFKPTAHSSIYASYATSSTPPGSFIGEGSEGNAVGAGRGEVLASLDDLKVEKTKSYEVGAKADLLDETLSLTLALFRTETDNARITGPTGLVEYVGNRRIDGVEFGFSGNITPEWNVFGGYTYLDAKIRDGGATATTGGGITIIAPSVNTGKRFPQTPKHSATLWTSYDVTPALKLGGGAFYVGRVYGGYSDTRVVQNGELVITKELARSVPGYVRFDANLSYRINEALDLAINVQNLTNKRYYSQAYSSHYAAIAPGRSAFATLSFRY